MRDEHGRLKIEAVSSEGDRRIFRLVVALCEGPDWNLEKIAPMEPNSDSPDPYHMFCHLAAYCLEVVLRERGEQVTMRSGHHNFQFAKGQHLGQHSWLELPSGAIIDPHPESIGVYALGSLAIFIPKDATGGYEIDEAFHTEKLRLLREGCCHKEAVEVVTAELRRRMDSLPTT